MIKSKLKLLALCIVVILVQNCTLKQKNTGATQKDTLIYPIDRNNKGAAQTTIIDTLPIYAEVKVLPYTLDSIMAKVTIVNDWHESVWLYKPYLPIDSFIGECFVVRTEQDNREVPHIHTNSPQRLINAYVDMIVVLPLNITDTSQLELKPGSRISFYD